MHRAAFIFIRIFLQTEFITVLDKVALKPSEACGVLIGDGCGSPYNPLDQNWTIPLPTVPKPPVVPIKPPAVSPGSRLILN